MPNKIKEILAPLSKQILSKTGKWFLRHSLTIASCVLITGLGIAFLVWSSPQTTTIGENISTGDLTLTGAFSCSGCVSSTDVNFNYAGSASKGGAATDLVCTECVTSTDIGTIGACSNICTDADTTYNYPPSFCSAGSSIRVINADGTVTCETDDTGMTNPMTTAEDLIKGGTGGTPERLAKGAEGKILGIASGVLAWVDKITTFLGLSDTPSGYTDQAGKVVKVNSGEDSLEFAADLDTRCDTSGTCSQVYEGASLLSDLYLGKTAKAADSDKLDGLDSTDFARATCPSGMVYIPGSKPFCIDKYEAYLESGTVTNCTCTDGSQAEVGACASTATAGSASGKTPLTSINWCAAKKACQNAGKHLCTNQEWFQACNYEGGQWNITAEETAETMSCNTASECGSAACTTEASSGCVTQEGAYDMIGNVWEWVDKVVTTDPTVGLTTSGFITGYDLATALPNATGTSSNLYGNDYFYIYNGAGAARAAIRGGYWGYGAYAGCFTLTLDIAPSNSSSSVGFRCCR